MSDFRTIVIDCECCNGEGRYGIETGINYRDGSILGYWVKCKVCGGTGVEELDIEFLPITEEDAALTPIEIA